MREEAQLQRQHHTFVSYLAIDKTVRKSFDCYKSHCL